MKDGRDASVNKSDEPPQSPPHFADARRTAHMPSELSHVGEVVHAILDARGGRVKKVVRLWRGGDRDGAGGEAKTGWACSSAMDGMAIVSRASARHFLDSDPHSSITPSNRIPPALSPLPANPTPAYTPYSAPPYPACTPLSTSHPSSDVPVGGETPLGQSHRKTRMVGSSIPSASRGSMQ